MSKKNQRANRNRADPGSRQNSQQDISSRGQNASQQEINSRTTHEHGRGSGHEFRTPQSSFRSTGGSQGQTEYKETANNKRITGGMGGALDEDCFNAEEAHNWLQDRYKGVFDEYESYKKMEEKKKSEKNGKEVINKIHSIQSFSDVSNVSSAWGGGARPILPRNEDFLQTVQQAIQTLKKELPTKNNV